MTEQEKFNKEINSDLRKKGIIVPIVFAIIVAVAVIIIANPSLGIFPSGDHYDHLTTTAPTQTTEYVAK